jgi:hypothetical protein
MQPEENSQLALKMLDEARECIEVADPLQASEKLYKASQEAVKALAERFTLPEYEEAKRNDRWTAALLFSAARGLSEKFPSVVDCWDHAWTLHVEGFHEARLGMEEVKFRAQYAEKLVALATQ